MEQYFVRLAGEQKGPLSEQQVAEWYHNGLIDRNTECKSESEPVWKTVDDHFPTLKYAVPSPPAPPTLAPPPPLPQPANSPGPVAQSRMEIPAKIVITDIDIPFWSVFQFVFKWMVSAFLIACCIVPVVGILWVVAMAVLAALFNGTFSTFHR